MNAGGALRGIGVAAVAGERRRARIDERDEVGPRAHARQRIAGSCCSPASNSSNKTAAGATSSAPAEKPMMPIFFGSMFHSFAWARTTRTACCASYTASVCAIVAVAAQAVAQDDRVHAVVVEERDEVRAFGADVQRVVPAARHQDHRRAGVVRRIDDVHFDRRIVDVDDALNPPGHGALQVVLLGFGDPIAFEIGRVGREERHDLSAGKNRLRHETRRLRHSGPAVRPEQHHCDQREHDAIDSPHEPSWRSVARAAALSGATPRSVARPHHVSQLRFKHGNKSLNGYRDCSLVRETVVTCGDGETGRGSGGIWL